MFGTGRHRTITAGRCAGLSADRNRGNSSYFTPRPPPRRERLLATESDPSEADDGAQDRTESGTDDGRFDTELLSDLFVNVVPIAIIAAFVLLFNRRSPGEGGDPLLLFHSALIGGIVLVSLVAGWIIRGEDSPLEGSAATDRDGEADHE